jgi:S-adenosylmethionine synthetase
MRRNQLPPYRRVFHNRNKKGSRRAGRGYITNSGTSAGFGADGAFGLGTAMSV